MPVNHTTEQSQFPTPFLRWAGGKTWALSKIREIVPEFINNYHEPFLGGGSVFLDLKYRNKINKSIFLSDANQDLINTYIQIKDNLDEVIFYLNQHKNEDNYYYSIRKTNYNTAVENAAKFIYLNRTSFNGIYRVNRNGEYNVPFGYRSLRDGFFNLDNLTLISLLLQDAVIEHKDFVSVLDNIQENDLIFLDPPYTVAHQNNGFIEYNQNIFKWEDQIRLSEMLEEIKKRKAYFILTNAAHQSILNLFSKSGKHIVVERLSAIGGKGAKRQLINEFIFTNCE